MVLGTSKCFECAEECCILALIWSSSLCSVQATVAFLMSCAEYAELLCQMAILNSLRAVQRREMIEMLGQVRRPKSLR